MRQSDIPDLEALLRETFRFDAESNQLVRQSTGNNLAPSKYTCIFWRGTKLNIPQARVMWLLTRGSLPAGNLIPLDGVTNLAPAAWMLRKDFTKQVSEPARREARRAASEQRAEQRRLELAAIRQVRELEAKARASARRRIATASTDDLFRLTFRYDEETGKFFLLRPMVKRAAGDEHPGYLDDGYVQFSLRGKYVAAHRLAFLLKLGRWPNGVVDHINGNRSDNRWVNLRETTIRHNNANVAHKVGRNVVRVHGRFAPIWSTFSTYEEAAAAAALLDDPCAVLTGG